MVQASPSSPPTPQQLFDALAATLLEMAGPAVQLAAAQAHLAAHATHRGVPALIRSLELVANVLERFDLDSMGAAPGPQATRAFDDAFDETLARVHAARIETGRLSLGASARGSVLGPHVVNLRRELQGMQRQVAHVQELLDHLGGQLANGSRGRDEMALATTLARRAKTVQELYASGRRALDGIRICEEALAALIVRLKRELAPTYVEWKRRLAPVAIRAFQPQDTPFALPEAREVHVLLQRHVRLACEAARDFEMQQAQLVADVDAFGARARAAAEAPAIDTFGVTRLLPRKT